jgi:demethylmenaquinone methyltransferase/2-methoxy-6-polyprenyl-1,4-benzoquinol methylase
MLVKAGLRPGASHLDVGSGTGLCAAISQQVVGPSGRVVALDPSTGMLEVAKKRGVREVVEGRAESLPFSDGTFDVVSMSYMLRHIEDLMLAFSEARRVLRPGGRIVIFEVTRPTGPVRRRLFDLSMYWVVPAVGVVASARPSTFPMMQYWAETIESAARPERIVEALERAGFVGTRHLLELGVFSCYRGSVPLAPR